MIYELRTYTLKVRTLETVIGLFGERLEHRLKYSPLAGFWYTEIGPLNQIVHLWPYQDLQERARVREAFAKDPNWPPPILEHVVEMTSDVLVPFPSMAEIKPGKFGPCYELRSYILAPGATPRMRELWASKIEGRSKLTPNLLVGTTEFGELNKLIHIWPYQSLEQRAQVRKQAVGTGVWPPDTGGLIWSMENKIMLPAPFSPLQ
jgi:hypothetical protein